MRFALKKTPNVGQMVRCVCRGDTRARFAARKREHAVRSGHGDFEYLSLVIDNIEMVLASDSCMEPAVLDAKRALRARLGVQNCDKYIKRRHTNANLNAAVF